MALRIPSSNLHLVMVTLNPGLTIADVQNCLQRFPGAGWYRIADNAWVLHSHDDANTWYHRLRHLAHPGGRLFICRLDSSDRQGWMDKEFWKWVQEHQFTF